MREVRLSVGSMSCRHCVREVTGWLRDVPGVETISADATTGTVVVSGTMTVDEVLAAFGGSQYIPQVLPDPAAPATGRP
jgi:copper chaperone CopZ